MGIGLGYGPVIDLDDDLWGNAVNTASKLGEDTSEPGEILITEEFYAALIAEHADVSGCVPVEGAARKASFPYYLCK
ncbi:MAG: hypothetical protein HYZ53_04045 [Planctomycetes bacterium]|nr:hypothetical protein [Planctomycetota bacterium]